MNKDISKESAQQIAIEFMKQRKNTAKIDVAVVEQDHADWVVRGTCPIDMQGHPWAEKFSFTRKRQCTITSIGRFKPFRHVAINYCLA